MTTFLFQCFMIIHPGSKVHGAIMGPTWVLSAPDGPHVGPMNLAIRVIKLFSGGRVWTTHNNTDLPGRDLGVITIKQLPPASVCALMIHDATTWCGRRHAPTAGLNTLKEALTTSSPEIVVIYFD